MTDFQMKCGRIELENSMFVYKFQYVMYFLSGVTIEVV